MRTEDFANGGVDTELARPLLRRAATCRPASTHLEALLAAAILAYQRAPATPRGSQLLRRHHEPEHLRRVRVPFGRRRRASTSPTTASRYRLRGLRHRLLALPRPPATVKVVAGHPARGGQPTRARLELGGSERRACCFDPTDAGLRVEIEGRRALASAGRPPAEVRAGTPRHGGGRSTWSPATTCHGRTAALGRPRGDEDRGHLRSTGLAGVVKEVRARRGQQVAAGEVLLVIEPSADAEGAGAGGWPPRSPSPTSPSSPVTSLRPAGGPRTPTVPWVRPTSWPLDARLEPQRRGAKPWPAHPRKRCAGSSWATTPTPERATRLRHLPGSGPLPDDISDAFRWFLARHPRTSSRHSPT